MAEYDITSPDGKQFRVTAPDDASQDQVLAYAQKNFQMAAEVSRGTIADTMRSALRSAFPMGSMALENTLGVLGMGKDVAAGGVRGAGSIGATVLRPFETAPENAQRRQSMDEALQTLGANTKSPGFAAGKLGAEIAGTAAIPGVAAKGLGMIPGVSALAGPLLDSIGTAGMSAGGATGLPGLAIRGAGGGISGALTAGAIDPKDTATGAVIGATVPVVGKLAGDLGSALRAQGATDGAQNAMKDAALAEGRAAGYKVPNSEVAPTFLGNRLESLGGKAAIKQEATLSNQKVTNELTRKALGIPSDVPISQSALDDLRKTAGQAYKEVADISPQAAADLEALKTARNEAQGWFNAYNRSARPDDLAKAKAARTLSDQLENALEQHAFNAGNDFLIPQLRDARQLIAKTYTVERALNKATGDVSAPVIGRLFDKGKPLSDGLETVGKFNQAFPKFTGNAVNTPAPGVSKVEALSSALLGAGGAAVSGSPMGILAAGLPLLSHPARALALSKFMERTPQYAAQLNPLLGANLGLLTQGAYRSAPALAGLLDR